MTFRNDAQFDTKTVGRSRGAGGAIAGGGGILITIVLFVVSSFLGIDLTGLANGGGGGQSQGPVEEVQGCTGADANDPANIDCRMEGASDSLETYWAGVFQQNGVTYQNPSVALYEQAVSTGCGDATSAVGPFYCPPDQRIYIDTSFYQLMRDQFGAQGGNLAEMYVLAHEWGHHVQNLTGDLQRANQQDTGPAGSAVRSELQADCYAGAWIASASKTNDNTGEAPVIQSVSEQELAQALDAARVIGDDQLQQHSGQGVNPDAWTHGSSEQRQTWLLEGYRGGAGACAAVWTVPQP